MLTLESLRAFGANVNEGLARCVNNEAFYLRMVQKVIADEKSVADLKAALDAGDQKAGFEAAHKLKGVFANLSLTPLLRPAAELTEILRGTAQGDAAALFAEVEKKFAELKALAE